MAYKAIKLFTDMQDGDYRYDAGDTFPRVGLEVSSERIAGLLGNENGQGEPVIAEVGASAKLEDTPVKPAKKATKKE